MPKHCRIGGSANMAGKVVRLLLCAVALAYIVYAYFNRDPIWMIPLWTFMPAMCFWVAWNRRRQGNLPRAHLNMAAGLMFVFMGLATMTRWALSAVIGTFAALLAAIVLIFHALNYDERIV